MIFENRGTDANKKVNGRKRQLLPGRRAVDTVGRIWFAHVHAGNQHDGPAALNLSADILCQNERLQKIYSDQAYNGSFARKMEAFRIEFEKASRPESTTMVLHNDSFCSFFETGAINNISIVHVNANLY